MELLKGKRTYLTVAVAVLYMVASSLGIVESNKQLLDAFELIALGFLRAAIKTEDK